MGGSDVCRYIGVDVGLGRMMAAWRSMRIFFTLILVGLVLSDYLVYCVLRFPFCLLRFAKSTIKIPNKQIYSEDF